MSKFRKIFCLSMLALASLFIATIAWEAFSTPYLPNMTEPVRISDAMEDIVRRQWSRPGSIPDDTDLADYQSLILEAAKLDYDALRAKRQHARELTKVATQRWEDKLKSYHLRKQMLETNPLDPRGLLVYFQGVSLSATEYRLNGLRRLDSATNFAIRQRAEVRYNLAVAYILAGKEKEAIDQLRAIIKENGTAALSYQIIARAGAHNDADFVREFEADGSSIKPVFSHYIQDPNLQQLHPRSAWRYEER